MRAFAEATVRAVLAAGDETEDAAATGLGSAEAEAGIALLTVEAAKGDISGEDLEVRVRRSSSTLCLRVPAHRTPPAPVASPRTQKVSHLGSSLLTSVPSRR